MVNYIEPIINWQIYKNMYCRLNNMGADIAQATTWTIDEYWFDFRKEQ